MIGIGGGDRVWERGCCMVRKMEFFSLYGIEIRRIGKKKVMRGIRDVFFLGRGDIFYF